MRLFALQIFIIIFPFVVIAGNPIIPNKGANDPHIRVLDGKLYLSATHDKAIKSEGFAMEDWWLWSSDDLVNWNLEYTLRPEETYIGKAFNQCWATDIAKRNGKFYWYFSESNQQTGVMVGDSPKGPWKDVLRKPLLTSEMTPTHEYDMGIIEDAEGDFYIVFGVWDYYIAKLNKNMVSLAERPKKIVINNPRGPYNLDGKNAKKPTDDKPFMHFYKGKYYLSWGCFYAMSDDVYGPYHYKGSIIEQESFAPGYDAPTWPTGFRQGRHGSFFQWNNQWYFAYCDISQTGNRYFRDTFISYIHYKTNGEMALIRVDGIGVGEYDVDAGTIEAEDFYEAKGIVKKEHGDKGFVIDKIDHNDYLVYQNVKGLRGKTKIELSIISNNETTIELRENSNTGKVLAKYQVASGDSKLANYTFDLPKLANTQTLCFVFCGKGENLLQLDAFKFK